MHIREIEIDNYRTFRQVRLVFDKRMNYIVGPNRIGKTNFLRLLEALHERYRFVEDDFLDKSKPIRILLTLQIEGKQTLLFKGMPLEDANTVLRLEITQGVEDLIPKIRNGETGEDLPLEWLRCIRYLRHIPYRFVREGISDKEQASLVEAIKDYFTESGSEVIEMIKSIAEDAGTSTKGIEKLAYTAESWVQYLSRDDFRFRASERSFHTVMVAGFQLLAELLEMKKSQAVLWEENLLVDSRGRRFLPLMVSIDEPEIHLHPYLQRSLLEFYHHVMANDNPLMRNIFSHVLDIDGVEGQLFVVTNSTDCLVDDYRNITRLYRDELGEVKASCGAEFTFAPDVEKHLIMHFPEVKEALYARSVLIVEGETEYGAFKGFARAMRINFDFLGICLINARGESSIDKIAQLFKRFRLGTVALYDADVRGKNPRGENIFFTDELCFELDIVLHCQQMNKMPVLAQAIHSVGNEDGYVTREMTRRAANKWTPDAKRKFTAKKLKNISGRDYEGQAFYYFAWLYSNKGVIVGRTLAKYLTGDLVPPAFQRVIRRAADLAR